MPERAHIIGGRYAGMILSLPYYPGRLSIGGVPYIRLDDPDTGEFLGAYTHQENEPPPDIPRKTWLKRFLH